MGVKLFASRFQVMMALQGGACVVRIGEGDYGVYPRGGGFRHEHGMIAARGSQAEVERFLSEMGVTA